MNKEIIRSRRKARKLALQALYQWLMSGQELYDIEAQFRVINNMAKVDVNYFSQLLHDVPEKLSDIEACFTPFLDRDLQTLNPVELTVLRIGTYELLYSLEVPYKVVLDESVLLAKEFGSQDGHRYVNGVLNGVARKVRHIETKLDHG